MPPRIPQLSRLGQANLCFRPATKQCSPPSFLPLTSIANASSKSSSKPRHRDRYAVAQAQQRKAANIKRQEELQKLRKEALGDPVRGTTTPFIESFDTGMPTPSEKARAGELTADRPNTPETTRAPLNYFLKPEEVEKTLEHSFVLTQPIILKDTALSDPVRDEQMIREHKEGHERAVEAISRITALQSGNRKDRTRVNVQRCIETFGRHNTDKTLEPRPAAVILEGQTVDVKTPRAGLDTGSSEVQVAILTAKIRNLANHLEAIGRTDKVNKRNLRLLVHRRQKLLAYLRRKERGGPRWQHLIETLGLTEGTWRGEITL